MAGRQVTVTGLAAEIGVSRKHLSNVLNGHVPLIDPLLGRLCRALWVERSFLVCLTHAGPMPEPAPQLHKPNKRHLSHRLIPTPTTG